MDPEQSYKLRNSQYEHDEYPLEGFVEYKAREFCNDVKCPVQVTLNKAKDKPEIYELVRQTCSTACRYSTWQFHHWLIEKGYLIVKQKDENE